MEIRFVIDDDYIKELQKQAQGTKVTQITSEAIALFKWAMTEVMNGRKIVALDEQNEKFKEITTPILEKAAKREAKVPA